MLIKIIGSRAVVVANVAALFVAAIVAIESAYILQQWEGFHGPADILVAFFPAIVMFIVRKKAFSFWFLFFYVALAVQMFFEARLIYLGFWHPPRIHNPLGYSVVFIFISAICLAIYLVVQAIGFLIGFAVRYKRRALAYSPLEGEGRREAAGRGEAARRGDRNS